MDILGGHLHGPVFSTLIIPLGRFARFGIQVSTDRYKDPFLSSVIPMVAQTWCHRAIGGNPNVGCLEF